MDLTYEIYIAAKPEDVWNIFVKPEGTKAIFFGCILESTFEIGARYEYIGPCEDGTETVHVYGNILAFEPYKMMSYTEHPGPLYRENHAELETRVTLKLETVGDCTKLTLINDQWPENHPSYENTKSTWPMILSNVKTFAETGKTLNFGW
ncbi:SRPBCC family protein [Bacillus sp. EAC]|uniref:SRPBCC family protein n=1 Tax=Bacillus sp. EAC TaxID=1978338 RepID=UPI000B450095|nr:SRPBCC family protein [Bacillus sp. EAC]